ncbi:hypothetical protein GCM10025783_18220 [Amnibacterium soli]|uniref:Multidrug transporter n=2 Tax=Amnibacterium soli TaxID=1282736 RepID=A0ABP8Z4Y3_9MICO
MDPGERASVRFPGSREDREDGVMTDAERRKDQLTTAPAATEEDAAPRIDVDSSEAGVRRITVRDDAAVRPGGTGD